MEKKIWVLGSEHPNAHKSIPWKPPFPNFANCDILIVNLESLGGGQHQRILTDLQTEARKYVFDLLMTGEKESIVILSPEQSQLEWLPLFPILRRTAPAELGEYTAESPIDEYLKNVETCPYYIHQFDASYFRRKTNPTSEDREIYPFTSEASEYGYEGKIALDSGIFNRAKQRIGCRVRFVVVHASGRFETGGSYFLPPPTEVEVERAIDIMVSILTSGELMETPPEWENDIDLPELENVESQIAQIEVQKKVMTKEVKKLEKKKDKLIIFRRLLWTKGIPLENAVRDAFLLLGFSEIGKIREKNLEDWVMRFESESDYKYGILEVKGADKRTSLADLTQCNKWVEDYLLEKRGDAKGIFVANQFRLGDISRNKKEREHFEENELKYARQREICILPSHEVFDAVVERMKGNTEITRKFVEERMATSKGICRLIER
ncbi:MAG: hypothetical protein KAW09_08145 [Thermoplasmata archaeon]|nr:hypothetical protein [Thermoplasmata archaeon]